MNAHAGLFEAAREAVDPDMPIGVEHHLDDRAVFEEPGDGRTKRGAQHARAAYLRFGTEVCCRHS